MQIKNVKNSTLFFNPSLSGPTGQTATWCRSRHEISPSLRGKESNRLRRSLSVSFLTQTDQQSVSLNLRSKYIIQYHHLNYMISIPFTVQVGEPTAPLETIYKETETYCPHYIAVSSLEVQRGKMRQELRRKGEGNNELLAPLKIMEIFSRKGFSFIPYRPCELSSVL